jgi:glycerol-3-phosphate dehydrogenase
VLNDLRRDLRLGMGPCQAAFCAVRAAGLLHRIGRDRRASEQTEGQSASAPEEVDVRATNSALVEFLQERWKGLLPVMWGANLRQLELDLNIYRNLLGADRLPVSRPPEVYPTERTA